MSPYLCSCVVCGWVIVDMPGVVSWANQFRGLYSGPTGIVITGVGLYSEPNGGGFIAPVNYDARWDDDGYDSPEQDQFGAMRGDKVNDRHGFLFHEACWSLLKQVFLPQDVPLRRLHAVCGSLPIPYGGSSINWGHDYGGIVHIDNEHRFPWEDGYVAKEYHISDPKLSANPYNVPDLTAILAETPESPPEAPKSLVAPSTARLDCFLKLSLELRSAIATLLPTEDFLAARLSSRAFWHVYDSQQFWASRFNGFLDRSWLFELHGRKDIRDWRWLYHRTKGCLISPNLQNRKRIWSLAGQMKTSVNHTWGDITGDSSSAVTPPKSRNEVVGDIYEPPPPGQYNQFNHGCRMFHKRMLLVPDDLRRVRVHFVKIAHEAYVAGLALDSAANGVRQIGYHSSDKENQRSLEITELLGFNTAVCAKGIQALQCISGNGSVSEWLGCGDTSLKTKRLTGPGSVAAIECGFDGCKLVSLAIHRQESHDAELAQSEGELRDLAIWFPEIPGPHVCVNDESFLPKTHFLAGFKPLFWSSFGGTRGADLQYLTQVTCFYGRGILRMEFYRNGQSSRQQITFGRLNPVQLAHQIDFHIDGPGGEVIEAVDVFQRYENDPDSSTWLDREGFSVACRLHTNRGRSTIFTSQSRSAKIKDQDWTRLSTAPGTTITGFYATQQPDYGYGITALGILSEIVQSEENGRAQPLEQ